MCLGYEIAVGLALSDHFLAVGVKGVVDDPLRGVDGVIVFVSEMAKSLGDRFEPWSFRLVIKRIVSVGAVHDLSKQRQRRIFRGSIFLQNCLERALLAMMT